MTQTELKRRRAKCVETLRVAGGESARWLRWEIERLDAALAEMEAQVGMSHAARLERAERKLRHLRDYRDNAKANHGVIHNPGFLDERIERARAEVDRLRASLGVLL